MAWTRLQCRSLAFSDHTHLLFDFFFKEIVPATYCQHVAPAVLYADVSVNMSVPLSRPLES